jgi:hypothetical protein
LKEFKVFKDILDMLMSIWVNTQRFKELMNKYYILKVK